MRRVNSRQKGLSLIELMIAVLLGLIVIGTVIEIFLNSRQVYRVQNAKAHIQENGRYAVHLLGEVIQDIGYQGCGSLQIDDNDVLNNLDNPAAYTADFSVPVAGSEWDDENANWSPSLDATITGAIQGNDVLILRGPVASETLISQHSNGSNQLTVGSGHGLEASDIVMVTDCESAVISEVDGVNATTLSLNATLGKTYQDGSITRVLTRTYYISTNPENQPALYVEEGLSGSRELVSNIESLQLSYGQDDDNDGSADLYRNADEVTDWNEVVSVRLQLVAVSEEDNLTVDGPQNFVLNSAVITPGDNRLRTVFIQTITLRNRVP